MVCGIELGHPGGRCAECGQSANYNSAVRTEHPETRLYLVFIFIAPMVCGIGLGHSGGRCADDGQPANYNSARGLIVTGGQAGRIKDI